MIMILIKASFAFRILLYHLISHIHKYIYIYIYIHTPPCTISSYARTLIYALNSFYTTISTSLATDRKGPKQEINYTKFKSNNRYEKMKGRKISGARTDRTGNNMVNPWW